MSNLINWKVSEGSNAVNLNGIVTMEGKNKIIIIKINWAATILFWFYFCNKIFFFLLLVHYSVFFQDLYILFLTE